MLTYQFLYHALFQCMDESIAMLENGFAEEACAKLKQGLLYAENCYIECGQDIIPDREL